MRKIRTAAVLGSGVMGSAIAGYLAGAGIPCHLLDIVPEGAKDRDVLAKTALQKLTKMKPPYIFSPRDLKRVLPGNLEDHLERLKEADWIIEAVVEKLDIKRALFENVQKHRKEGAIVSSNTSGIPLKEMVKDFPEDFQKHFLITHFFNPVRYMRLLEIIPGEKTLPEVVEKMVYFGEYVLGKGIVYAKDTPNFIANRIGVYGKLLTIHEALSGDFTVEEVDKIFGELLGRPKSAVFRTADIVGLDTTANVVKYLGSVVKTEEEKRVFTLPEFYQKMIENKWLGEKVGSGFYKVEKSKEGKEILSLNLKTLEYGSQKKVESASISKAKEISSLPERIRKFIMEEDDRMAKLARKVVFKTLLYALSLIPEISDDIVNVDNALKWGYNWEIGLFETWDALGVEASAKRMEADGYALPENLKKLLASSAKSFYKTEKDQKQFFDFKSSSYIKYPTREYKICLAGLHEKSKIVYQSSGASLLDLGDDVLSVEIHTEPVNMIDDDVVTALEKAVDLGEKNFRGIVVANQGDNFCVGANLMLVALNIQAQNWDALRDVVRRFQRANQRLKYCQIPVVAAPFGLVLGGGCELALAANHIHSSMELYMGLVEVGVGLVPAGGGCLNMLKHYLSHVPTEVTYDPSPMVRQLFEVVGMAKVSSSAKEARELKFLLPSDTITLNPDRLIYEAKKKVLAMSESYIPEEPWENFTLPGEGGLAAFKYGLYSMRETGIITEYDAVVGEKLASIFCGGKVSFRSPLQESYILELEEEAFLSLCGEERTVARIQHMLMNKKPLRN